ncbi:hypothetical protein RchiOBHm_Chr7g0201221 [Rosa chinensis]|uniref:Uncharacterized protein n=1 Tax=Rosa chinensis TaxID=74649 RepID=A0A2P6P7V9_ROSCH|nr:hypothetical protein RchiOBHm_Chr7g0201221 [Rosa chinensis]
MCTITSQNTRRFFVFSMHLCTITSQNTIQFLCFFSSFSAFLFLLYSSQIKIKICKITIQSFAFCTFIHSSSLLNSSGLRLWPLHSRWDYCSYFADLGYLSLVAVLLSQLCYKKKGQGW